MYGAAYGWKYANCITIKAIFQSDSHFQEFLHAIPSTGSQYVGCTLHTLKTIFGDAATRGQEQNWVYKTEHNVRSQCSWHHFGSQIDES